MTWTRLPAPPIGFEGTTASGTDFILVHADNNRKRHFPVLGSSDGARRHRRTGCAVGWTGSTRPRLTSIARHRGHCQLQRGIIPAGTPSGRIVMVNDGGAVVSNDGAKSWQFGAGLSTLGLVNTAVLPRRRQKPSTRHSDRRQLTAFSAPIAGENDARKTIAVATTTAPSRILATGASDRVRAATRLSLKSPPIPLAPAATPDGSWGTDDCRKSVPSPPPPPGKTKGPMGTRSATFTTGVTAPSRSRWMARLRYPVETSPSPSSSATIEPARGSFARRRWPASPRRRIGTPRPRPNGPTIKVFRQGPELPESNDRRSAAEWWPQQPDVLCRATS